MRLCSRIWHVAFLIDITLPSKLATISDQTFYNCGALNNVTMPAHVTSIARYAFWNCSGLRNLFFEGNAPVAGVSIFNNANNVTVYYLQGTTGWGSSYAGRQTILRSPTVRHDINFDFAAGWFGFTVASTSTNPLVVQAADDLSAGNWLPLTIATIGVSSPLAFDDLTSSNVPYRFYRIVWP